MLRCGTAVGWEQTSDRYTVVLDELSDGLSGRRAELGGGASARSSALERIAVRGTNLRPAPPRTDLGADLPGGERAGERLDASGLAAACGGKGSEGGKGGKRHRDEISSRAPPADCHPAAKRRAPSPPPPPPHVTAALRPLKALHPLNMPHPLGRYTPLICHTP